MLGFVLPAVLYLKTHEVEVRSAYTIAHAVYHGDSSSANGAGASRVRTNSDGGVGVGGGDNGGVVNPLSGESEVTIQFNHIDDTEDIPPSDHRAGNRRTHLHNAPHTYLCNPIQHTKLWAMIEPFRKFWLAFFMIVFGLICLIIGVITVFMDNS